MTFTIANQQDNSIANTTTQTVKHFIYSNNEVSISGINNVHSVWHKQGKRVSKKVSGLNLAEAVDFANNLMKSI